MNFKFKLFLGFLVLIACFSVYGVFHSLNSRMSSATILDTKTSLPNPDDDPDHDGLTNQQEAIWGTDPFGPDTDSDGYKDGEEVSSGHNPVEAGPNDLLPSLSAVNDQTNVTERTSEIITSGIYAGVLGETTDENVSNQAVASIANDTILSNIKSLDPNSISTAPPVMGSDSKDSQDKYLNQLASIIQNNLWSEIVAEPRIVVQKFADFNGEDAKAVAESKQYFDNKVNHYSNVLSKMSALEVPPSWLEIHTRIINDLKILIINHRALSNTGEDPLKSLGAGNNLMGVYQDVQPILFDIVEKIKTNRLTPPSGGLWNLITSLANGL